MGTSAAILHERSSRRIATMTLTSDAQATDSSGRTILHIEPEVQDPTSGNNVNTSRDSSNCCGSAQWPRAQTAMYSAARLQHRILEQADACNSHCPRFHARGGVIPVDAPERQDRLPQTAGRLESFQSNRVSFSRCRVYRPECYEIGVNGRNLLNRVT